MIFALTLALFNPKLDAVLDVPELKGAVVGAVVTEMDGAPLYDRNGSMRVMPASNMKIPVSAAALALASLPQLDDASRRRIRRMVTVPQTSQAEWDFVAARMDAR